MYGAKLFAGLIGTFAMLAPAVLAHHPDVRVPHIYATGWGITLAADGSGFYNDFAHFALGEEAAPDNYVVAPYRRAMRNFKYDKTSCVYPKSLDVLLRAGEWGTHDQYIESDALMQSPVRVFTPPGTVPIHDRAELKGKRLAYTLGSRLPQSLGDVGAEYVPIADEVDKAKLLSTGIVDAIVVNMPDARFVFQHLQKDLPSHDHDFDLVPVHRIRIVCHDTENNRAFIRQLNARLKLLRTSNRMAEYLESLRLKPNKYLP